MLHPEASETTGEEPNQRSDHSSNAENTSIKSNLAKSVTQQDWSRDVAGNASRMHAKAFSFQRKNSDKPSATTTLETTDMDRLEEQVHRLKCDVHEMLGEFQDLRAFAQLLETQLKDVRRDRQQMGS